MLCRIALLLSIHLVIVFANSVLYAQRRISPPPLREILSFDEGWRFQKGEVDGAEKPEFDDSRWRRLDVPHDWSIEGPIDPNNPTGGDGGFLPSGVGWYRKSFRLPARAASGKVFLQFDGVMSHSRVWINGQLLGFRPNGYVSFRYDLTPHLRRKPGEENVVAVRTDTSAQPASRWYTGAGIYRHVRLILTSPVYLEQWATFVSTPEIRPEQAAVRLTSRVKNESGMEQKVRLRVEILDEEGRLAARGESVVQPIPAGKAADFEVRMSIGHPRLWGLKAPSLYRARVIAESNGEAIDEEQVSFGIREARFDAATGFWLNGENIKIKGVCLHHDGGAVGAAVPLRVWERRLEILKNLGVNAIRTAHNPPAPEFLDLCDRMGFLVMDEMFDVWTVAKRKADYHLYFNDWSKTDTRDTVMRDRNHPSVILYSAGNEIRDTPNAELAKSILGGLLEVFHSFDPTRPVTQALFRPNQSRDYDNGLADMLDVIGQNYRENELLAAHRAKPSRRIIGTENGHDLQVWLALRDHPEYSGQFLWTGIDYLGEARRWPTIGAGSGLLDRTGWVKPVGRQRQSWWAEEPMVYAVRRTAPPAQTPKDPGFEPLARPQTQFPDWTPANLQPHEETVEVYSNCEEVELLLNGRSLGVQHRPADDSPRVWKVIFEPGLLRAAGRNKGKHVAEHVLRTAGEPAAIRLAADRRQVAPRWDDVVHLQVEIVDAQGVPVPSAAHPVRFEIRGPGYLQAVDNGHNASAEPFQGPVRLALQGRCLAIARAAASKGSFQVRASAPGLQEAAVEIQIAGR